MRRIISVLCAILLLCVPEVFADGTLCSQETGTVVVFGNGIMNTKKDATRSKNLLKEVLRATLTPEEFGKLEFKVAYNHTYGRISDLYESLKQQVSADNVSISFWRWLGGQEVLPDVVQRAILSTVTRFDFSTMVAPEDLSNHLALYRAKILAGKKVLVVSHSQGNFFANAAYELLYNGASPIPLKSFGIVSVATPANYVGGNGPYTTLAEDGLIEAVRIATLPGVLPPLPPNITNILSDAIVADWEGHSFMDAYMASGSRSVAKIVPDIINTMNGLDQPAQTVQDGIITVTLTWGSQPDLDLHVFEPGGSHVYYLAKQGASGHLDADDTTGFGPEHYYVSCSTLQTGTYSIGVNYYYGTGPETAQVQISAGTSVRNFTTPLTSVRGSSGNASPTHVADVAVTGSAAAGFVFNIVGGS